MLRYYRVQNNRLAEIPECESGCIVSLVSPTPDEIAVLRQITGLGEIAIADALDPDEPPRMEVEDDMVYVVFRAPWVEGNETREDFTTPVTAAFTGEYTVIINPHGCHSIQNFFSGQNARHLRDTQTRIMACLFETIAVRYLAALRTINASIKQKERSLGNMSDDEQLQLLHMQNCLIYFQAALRGNELILERVLRTRLRLASAVELDARDDDLDIFDDTLINIRQAAYTARIYAEVMDFLLRTHAAALSARVNTAMKVLTSLTLVLMIPTLVTSAYGMNVPLPFQNLPQAFVVVGGVSVLTSVLSVYFLWKKGWFSSKA